MGNKLENLKVERTDGVDRPATGRTWMIVKNERGAAEGETDYAALSKSALEALAKEEGLTFGDEAVEALKALAEAHGIELEFSKGEEPEAPKAEAAADEGGAKDEDAPVTRGELADVVAKTIRDLFAEEFDEEEPVVKEDDEAPTTRLVAKSKQPKHQDSDPVEKSDGRVSYSNLFEQ